MFKSVESENFVAEPSYFKHMMLLGRKPDTNNPNNSQIQLSNTEIDELIELLQKTKEQFRK